MMTPKAMGKRVFGIGIIATGLLVLAIALIMGLEFPKYVWQRNIENVCIVDKKHPKFDAWSRDIFRDTYNRVYFWHLKNKDGFFRGQQPLFEERGPYIYQESQEKFDVIFVSHTAQFYLWRKQTFRPDLTMQECGRICSEQDQITLINPNYLKEVSLFGDDLSYTLHHLPAMVAETIDTITRLHQQPEEYYYSILLLTRSADALDRWRAVLRFPYTHFSFASWLHQGDTHEKRTVIGHRGGRTEHSLAETHALYEALSNEDLIGKKTAFLKNETIQRYCDSLAISPYRLKNITYRLSPASSNVSVVVPDSCGLIHALKLYKSAPSAEMLRNVSQLIAQLLCTDRSVSCFDITQNRTVQEAYINVIYDYIFVHLPRFVHFKSVMLRGEGLVATRSQADWSLGYYSANDSARFVPGILENYPDKQTVKQRSKHVTLTNCYDGPNANTNFMWKGYDRRRSSGTNQFPFASRDERDVRSRFRSFPPVHDLRACVTYTLPEESYDVFLPRFWRRVRFSRQGTAPSIGRVALDRLTLNSSSMAVDGAFILEEDGLQEMNGTNGYLSWVSLPNYLHSNQALPDMYKMHPNADRHTSIIDVEMRSGDVWRETLRHQHNVGVRPDDVRILLQLGNHVNASGTPLPVYWLETSAQYNDLGISDYRQRIDNLMRTSCGGMVGLSAVAAAIIVFGFLAATVTIRGGRIAPILVEEGSLA